MPRKQQRVVTNKSSSDSGKASITTSVFNLANNVAGAGILTLAAGKASGTGWIPSMGRLLGVHDTWNSSRLWQYTSLITHIFAHSDYGHLKGNMTHLLLVGPGVEHAFGSKNLMLDC